MGHRAILSSLVKAETDEEVGNAARQEGCAVEFILPYGTLITGSRRQLAGLEKKGYRVKILTGTDSLQVGECSIKTDNAEQSVSPLSLEQEKIWSHYLLQLIAPPALEWVEELGRMGVDVVEPVSAYGLFVVCGQRELAEVQKLPYVIWSGPFLPEYRVHGSLRGLSGVIKYVNIAVYPPQGVDAVMDAVIRAGGNVERMTVPPAFYCGEYGELLVEAEAAVIHELAGLPDVRWLEYAQPRPGMEGEREVQIAAGSLDSTPFPDRAPLPGYDGWLQGLGLKGGSGVRIAVCDSGVDANQDNNKTGHMDLRGRQHSFVNYSKEQYPNDFLRHGTHIASIAVGGAVTGQKDDGGFLWGQGVAPRAEFINQNVLVGPWPPDWTTVVRDAAARGALIMNNSWCTGSNPGSGYTLAARTFDRLIRDAIPGTATSLSITIVFSAGNAGPHVSSITPPKEAKNAIVVGNSLTYRPHKRFRCGDIRGIFGTSSRGPARDGRLLPTLVAPGTDVAAALSRGSRRTPITGTGGTDVASPDRMLNQYVYMTGSSMSAALVSGACALLTEWWRRRTGGQSPSPALLKALLVNGAEDQAGGQDWRCLNGESNKLWEQLEDGRYCCELDFWPLTLMSGFKPLFTSGEKDVLREGEWHYSGEEKLLYVRTFGGCDPQASDAPLLNALATQPLGHLPDSTQGWGRVNLNNILLQSPATGRGSKIVIDGEYHFTASGQEFIIKVAPVDSRLPLRVTLVWTDSHAAVGSGRVLVNDLDLEVREIGEKKRLYKGNVMTGGYSRAGADYDSMNNVECVYLREPRGLYEVRVVAAALRALARPPFGCTLQWQDFALVIDNAEQVTEDSVTVIPVIEHCERADDTKKNYSLKIACKQLLVSLRAGDRVGLTGLDGNFCLADFALALQTITGKSVRKSTGSRILAIRKRGCISQATGVAAAQALLTTVPGRKAVLLFSGGRNNDCPRCDDPKTVLEYGGNITVHTCSMGPLARHGMLAELATSHGGNYYYVPDTFRLAEVCNYLRADITGESVVLNETMVANSGYSVALVDNDAEEVSFIFSWPDVPKKLVFEPTGANEISVRLRDPDGFYVHPNSSWLYRLNGAGHVMYKIRRPPAGIWQLEMLTAEGKEIQYTVSAYVKSSLRLIVEPLESGKPFTVRATVMENEKPVGGWHATARIHASFMGHTEVRLRKNAIGSCQTASIEQPDNFVPFNVTVRTDGISAFTGTPFCRYRLISVPPREIG
ncbi:MAG: S8 family serine peptidase [Clostridiales bacterium]|jgi:hypothetical protein|nr:S8 family serine peptidase [Clostridiales bacterium]